MTRSEESVFRLWEGETLQYLLARVGGGSRRLDCCLSHCHRLTQRLRQNKRDSLSNDSTTPTLAVLSRLCPNKLSSEDTRRLTSGLRLIAILTALLLSLTRVHLLLDGRGRGLLLWLLSLSDLLRCRPLRLSSLFLRGLSFLLQHLLSHSCQQDLIRLLLSLTLGRCCSSCRRRVHRHLTLFLLSLKHQQILDLL